MKKIFATLALAAAVATLCTPANAATVFIYGVYAPRPVVRPVYAPVPVYVPAPMVAYDPEARFTGAYDIQGVITSAVPYHLTVRIHDQFYPVLEHDGTIINPTGITLTPTMVVNIAGFWGANGVFHANRINVLRY